MAGEWYSVAISCFYVAKWEGWVALPLASLFEVERYLSDEEFDSWEGGDLIS